MLPRYQPKPRRKVSRALERLCIANRRHHCRGGDRTDARYLRQAFALLAFPMPLEDLALEFRNAFVDLPPLFDKQLD
jgi:hypothetical protein